jgi:hypothetical protein
MVLALRGGYDMPLGLPLIYFKYILDERYQYMDLQELENDDWTLAYSLRETPEWRNHLKDHLDATPQQMVALDSLTETLHFHAQSIIEEKYIRPVIPILEPLKTAFMENAREKFVAYAKSVGAAYLQTLFLPLPAVMSDKDFDSFIEAMKFDADKQLKEIYKEWIRELFTQKPEHRLDFLSFVTASKQVPSVGFARLQYPPTLDLDLPEKFNPNGRNFFTSHTCFNTLVVPRFPNTSAGKANFKSELLESILNAPGIDLR